MAANACSLIEERCCWTISLVRLGVSVVLRTGAVSLLMEVWFIMPTACSLTEERRCRTSSLVLWGSSVSSRTGAVSFHTEVRFMAANVCSLLEERPFRRICCVVCSGVACWKSGTRMMRNKAPRRSNLKHRVNRVILHCCSRVSDGMFWLGGRELRRKSQTNLFQQYSLVFRVRFREIRRM